jgi:hypothetical protein
MRIAGCAVWGSSPRPRKGVVNWRWGEAPGTGAPGIEALGIGVAGTGAAGTGQTEANTVRDAICQYAVAL